MTVVTFVADGILTELASEAQSTLRRREQILDALEILQITNSSVLAAAVANTAAGHGNPYWYKERAAALAVSLAAEDDLNTAPTLAAIGGQNVTIGTPLDVTLTVADADADTLEFILTSSDTAKCLVALKNSTTITLVGLVAGTPTITVTVRDGRGGSATRTFVATVAAP